MKTKGVGQIIMVSTVLFFYGTIHNLKSEFESLLFICEYLDKDDEKHQTIYERDNEGDKGGVGKATFFEGLGK